MCQESGCVVVRSHIAERVNDNEEKEEDRRTLMRAPPAAGGGAGRSALSRSRRKAPLVRRYSPRTSQDQ